MIRAILSVGNSNDAHGGVSDAHGNEFGESSAQNSTGESIANSSTIQSLVWHTAPNHPKVAKNAEEDSVINHGFGNLWWVWKILLPSVALVVVFCGSLFLCHVHSFWAKLEDIHENFEEYATAGVAVREAKRIYATTWLGRKVDFLLRRCRTFYSSSRARRSSETADLSVETAASARSGEAAASSTDPSSARREIDCVKDRPVHDQRFWKGGLVRFFRAASYYVNPLCCCASTFCGCVWRSVVEEWLIPCCRHANDDEQYRATWSSCREKFSDFRRASGILWDNFKWNLYGGGSLYADHNSSGPDRGPRPVQLLVQPVTAADEPDNRLLRDDELTSQQEDRRTDNVIIMGSASSGPDSQARSGLETTDVDA